MYVYIYIYNPPAVCRLKEDLAKLEVKMLKQESSTRRAEAGWVFVSIAGMQASPWYYTESEAHEVAKKCEGQGSHMWIADEQFPGRKDHWTRDLHTPRGNLRYMRRYIYIHLYIYISIYPCLSVELWSWVFAVPLPWCVGLIANDDFKHRKGVAHFQNFYTIGCSHAALHKYIFSRCQVCTSGLRRGGCASLRTSDYTSFVKGSPWSQRRPRWM